MTSVFSKQAILRRNLIRVGDNRICGLHVIIHNGLFAECGVLDNYFRGLCGPRISTEGPRMRTRTRIGTCKLVAEDPRGQGLSSRTTLTI